MPSKPANEIGSDFFKYTLLFLSPFITEKLLKVGIVTEVIHMSYFYLFLLGIISGTVSGLLGIGGAIIIIPALVYIFKLSQHQAQGTSIAILLPPIGLLAFLEYYKAGHIDLKIAAFVALGFFLGGFLGGYLAQQFPAIILRKIFGFFLILIALYMIFE